MKNINIKDIIEKNSRLKESELLYNLQVSKIKNLIDSKQQNYDEMVKYSLISMVTCLELSFRRFICELIDYGDPYFKNIKKLKDNSFSFEFIEALNENKLTVGQFIANALPISSFEHIISHMDNILGEPFIDRLKDVKLIKVNDKGEESQELILTNSNKILLDIKEIFKKRHMCVHEFLTSEFLEEIKIDISDLYGSFFTFLVATTHLVNNLIHPTAYMTQAEMNELAGDECSEICDELDMHVNKIIDLLEKRITISDVDSVDNIKEDLNDFIESQKLWDEYSKISSNFYANLCRGGSIWSLMYNTHLSYLSKMRLDELLSIENLY